MTSVNPPTPPRRKSAHTPLAGTLSVLPLLPGLLIRPELSRLLPDWLLVWFGSAPLVGLAPADVSNNLAFVRSAASALPTHHMGDAWPVDSANSEPT